MSSNDGDNFQGLSDQPLPLIVKDCITYRNSVTGQRRVAGMGYRNDSAFFFTSAPREKESLLFLATGHDRTGDGKWTISPNIVCEDDFDSDGRDEIFLAVHPDRDSFPRSMAVIEPQTMTIEWQRSFNMPPLAKTGFLVRGGSPGVIFFVGGSDNGYSEGAMQDYFTYICRIDNHGQLAWARRASYFEHPHAITPDAAGTGYYVTHWLPIEDAASPADTSLTAPRLSHMDQDGRLLRSITLDADVAQSLWLADYDSDGCDDIYVLFRDGFVRVYDTSFTLLARSGPSPLRELVSALPNPGYGDSVLAFTTTTNTEVYDRHLSKLFVVPMLYGRLSAVRLDPAGHLISFADVGNSEYLVASLSHRSFTAYLAAVYQDGRYYVLLAFGFLLVGFLVTNFYRRRVTAQKRELEMTHEQLKQAQATIIAQEKYRQAKDIAGGFAHEIRNALFPGEAALTKLRRSLKSGDVGAKVQDELIIAATDSLRRAIGLTDLISRYTKLDIQRCPEPTSLAEAVERVITVNKERLESQGVSIETSGVSATLGIHHEHLHSVLNNLMLNSLDALTNRPDPAIIIRWQVERESVAISFSDNGAGIAPSDLPRVFEAFFSTKPNNGTGLGLSIVKKIIDMYGGSIEVSSQVGTGTTFCISLPLWLDGST